MKVDSVVRYVNGNISRNVIFGRAPKKGKEEKEYTQSLENGFRYLGIQNRALIMHGTSFPADKGGYDSNVGSQFGADKVVEFAKIHGFNQIQLGPNGKLNKGDTSPYTSSVFEKNPLMINEQMLTTDEFAEILSEDDIESVIEKTNILAKNYARIKFDEANENKKALLEVAFNNFQQKLTEKDESAIKLNDEFENFKQLNSSWINYYSVLNVIAQQNDTDYYPYWSKEDQDLIQNVKKGDIFAKARYEEIQEKNIDFIEKYKFTQFLVDKQAKVDAKNRGDFVYIGDIEVGTSSLDELVFKDVFLDGYKMGCPDGGPKNSPQLWGMAVLDPNKLFNHDGSLGPAGEFLRAKLINGMSGAQGIRIDHAIGLVNPYIYKEDSVHKIIKDGVEIPDKNRLKAARMCDIGLDNYHNFEKIIPRIVLPAMGEMKINPLNVVWEDLGWDETGVFQRVFKEQFNLPGIAGMKWTKSSNVNPKYTAYIGCHDDKPGRQIIDSREYQNWDYCWNPNYLASSIHPQDWGKRNDLERKIKSDPKEFWKAKVADLLKSGAKTQQTSFMDFFGINRTYNVPGTAGGNNWTLRLNPDYKKTYYESLENNGWALNMPEVLSMAVEAKMEQDIINGKNYHQAHYEADSIISDLNKWSQVLKEKS